MSRDDVDTVRRLYELFAEGSHAAALDLYDPEIRWDTSGLDWSHGRTFHGHDGVREFWRSWLHSWREYEATCTELIGVGDEVVARVRLRARGFDDRSQITLDHYQLWSLRNGLVVHVRFFLRRQEALEVAGGSRPPESLAAP